MVKLRALQAFDKVFDEHIELRRLCITFIRQAATTIYPIITERSRQGTNHAFWNSLGVPDDAVEAAPSGRDGAEAVTARRGARGTWRLSDARRSRGRVSRGDVQEAWLGIKQWQWLWPKGRTWSAHPSQRQRRLFFMDMVRRG